MTKRIKGAGKHGRPTYNQSAKIIAKFGGEAAFAKAIGISRITAYRHQYSKPYGTDGLIPSPLISKIEKAARLHGVLLTPADWLPEKINYEEQEDS